MKILLVVFIALLFIQCSDIKKPLEKTNRYTGVTYFYTYDLEAKTISSGKVPIMYSPVLKYDIENPQFTFQFRMEFPPWNKPPKLANLICRPYKFKTSSSIIKELGEPTSVDFEHAIYLEYTYKYKISKKEVIEIFNNGYDVLELTYVDSWGNKAIYLISKNFMKDAANLIEYID